MTSLCTALTGPLVGTLADSVKGNGAPPPPPWLSSLPALRSFISTNYNQPNPHNQAAMASPPTITTGAGTSGAPPAPYTALTTAYTHLAGTITNVMRMEGGGSATFSTDYRRFPVSTVGASGGNTTTTEDSIAWRATALVDAQSVAFSVLGGSASIPYRFIVNGQYVSAAGTIVSTGGRQYIVLDFGSKAARTITVESELAQGLRGIHVAPGDTVTLVAHTSRAICLGDSFTTGTGATRTNDGFAVVLRDALGLSDMWCSGVGGTGFVATASGTKYALPTRVAADMDRFLANGAASIVFVEMGINDIGQAGIQAAAESCLTTIRQKAPSAQIFVIGPADINAPAAPVTNYAACKAAIQAAIAARGGASAGIRFVDMEGVSYTKADGTHPNTAGHKTWAERIASEVATYLIDSDFEVSGAYTAVIGDSIDAGSPATASWFDECCRLSGQRMRNYLNKGVGGNTTADMLARINADIISQSPKPNVCVIGGPTNDHGTGVAPATTRQNIQDMVAALRAAGIVPILRNCPSNNNAGGGAFNTIALRRQAVLDHNTWLAGYCAANNIALIDIFTPTYDGTGLATSFTSDGTHFIAAGCYAAAKYASIRLPAYLNVAAKPYLTTVTSDPLNVVVNGVFVGDSNADGVANNCAVTSVTSPSLTANDYDGVGNWQNFTTTNGTLGFLDPAAGGVTAIAAHVYEAACVLKGVAGKIVKVRIQIRDVGNANLLTIDMVNDWTIATTDEVQVGFSRFVAPANAHHFSITVQGVSTGATGAMSCARFTIRDRTANP